jgi:hypothetical protein
MRIARLCRIVGCLAAVCSLSGCFAIEPPIGGAAIQSRGDSLLIAVCVSVTNATGRVSYRDLSVENEWIQVWRFDVDDDVDAGTIFSSDPQVTPPFDGEVRETIPIDPGVELVVHVDDLVAGSDSDSVFAGFTVPEAGLNDDVWLQQDGSTSAAPCP